MLTAILSRADVSRHVQALTLLRVFREALSAASPSAGAAIEAPALEGATSIRYASWPTLPAFAVTVRSSGRAVLQLHDAKTGKVLALIDAVHLTSLRSSLVGALAVDVLAREDACQVAVLGSGAAASGALKALRLVRSIGRVWLYEEDPAANTELSMRLQTTLATSVRATNSPEEAAQSADLVILTGGVSLGSDALGPGTHVTVLNADAFSAAPLPAPMLRRAKRFVDATAPALEWGAAFTTTLSEVLAKPVLGRQSGDGLTVFASVGPAALDLLAAWHVFERARDDEALVRLDLEA